MILTVYFDATGSTCHNALLSKKRIEKECVRMKRECTEEHFSEDFIFIFNEILVSLLVLFEKKKCFEYFENKSYGCPKRKTKSNLSF